MPTSRKKTQNIAILVGVAVLTFALGYLARDLIGTGGEFNFSGAAGMAASGQACDTSSMQSSDPTGITLGDPLNFRFGPGLDYSIVTALDYCTSAKLIGRNTDESWLLIQLPGNMEGWVYSEYVMSNVDLTDLKVATGFGGENTVPSGPTGKPDFSAVIQYNQAAVFITGMPANGAVFATLGPSAGSAKSLQVASGYADAQGTITLIFPMPATWSDGSKVESGTMSLIISSGDVVLNGWITYYLY
ncbi:MAG: SH3 domain-containing protein [Chloroflexota bacterium]